MFFATKKKKKVCTTTILSYDTTAKVVKIVVSISDGLQESIYKLYHEGFTRINSMLVYLVPSVSSYFIIFSTLILWIIRLALNTSPELNDIFTTNIHPSLSPVKLYLCTTAYALLFGAAGTSVYNLLNALDDSDKWALLAISILLCIVSCFKSPFLFSVLESFERPFGVTNRWGVIKYLFSSSLVQKG